MRKTDPILGESSERMNLDSRVASTGPKITCALQPKIARTTLRTRSTKFAKNAQTVQSTASLRMERKSQGKASKYTKAEEQRSKKNLKLHYNTIELHTRGAWDPRRNVAARSRGPGVCKTTRFVSRPSVRRLYADVCGLDELWTNYFC